MQGNRHWTGGGKTGYQCPVGQVNIKLVSVVVKIETLLHIVAKPIVAKPSHAGCVLNRMTSLACWSFYYFDGRKVERK